MDAAKGPMAKVLEKEVSIHFDSVPLENVIVNLSQSGYHINQVCRIVELELQKVKPQMVILAVNQYDAFLLPSEELRPDFQNGYRLPPARLFKGGSVDWLRSHSFVMMRCSFRPSRYLASIRRFDFTTSSDFFIAAICGIHESSYYANKMSL